MLSKKRRNSRSLHRVIAYIYSCGYAELPIVLFYLLPCLVYDMLFKTRRNSESLHRVIGEVLGPFLTKKKNVTIRDIYLSMTKYHDL